MEQTMESKEPSHLQKGKQPNSVSEYSTEPKFRLNIKQNAKKECYFDITVKGDTIEEVTVEIENLKRLAMIQCGQIEPTATATDTKDYKGEPSETKTYPGVQLEDVEETKVMKNE